MNINIPRGFSFSVAEAAIKRAGRKDLALIVSETESVASGMFTTNAVKAAPVLLDIKRIKSGYGRAIVINSGNANACTGSQGIKDAEQMTALIAKALGIHKKSVYVCSTGVIGAPMPMDRISSCIPSLANSLSDYGLDSVAEAIMTTDTFAKISSRVIDLGKSKATIAGIAKGAGMICPNMATMLSFILTDALISKKSLDKALRTAVKHSFNRITIDGDMSTNDTVLVFANGRANNDLIESRGDAFDAFSQGLSEVCFELATMIVKDGEGASKFITVHVKNARNDAEADKGAFAIANSMLVKTAFYGNDANWGRIMAALGYSGIVVKPHKTDISINGVTVVSGGLTTGRDMQAQRSMKGSREIELLIDLKLGKANSKVLTCDLTEGYVRINAEYRT